MFVNNFQMSIAEDNMKMNLAPVNVQEIKPQPGFCLKVKDEKEKKCFINVCTSAQIPPPKNISEAELAEILQSDEPPLYRVPMSISEPHNEKDKNGIDCITYDVAINNEYFEKIQKSRVFKEFFLHLCAEGIQSKYNCIFKPESFVILKKKMYHGTMPRHFIQERPMIAEVNSNMDDSKKSMKLKTPFYVVRRQPESGNPKRLIVEIDMPNVKSGNTISLSAGLERLVVFEKTQCYCLDIHLPYQILLHSCNAEFNQTNQTLTVYLPVSDS